MEYGKIEGVKKQVSRIIFGTAQPSFMKNEDNEELLDAVFAMGVNTFDLARVYRHAEDVVGRWMASRGNREEVVILTKCANPSVLGRKRVNARAIHKDLETSLKKLQTEYIDIYLLHRDDPNVDVAVPVEVMNELHAAGKIRAFGGSNWSHERIEAANEYAYSHNLRSFTVSSPNFGLAEQVKDIWGGGCVTISGPSNRAARAYYEEKKMPVVAYSSLGRGLFSGKLRSEDAGDAAKVLDSMAMKGYACPENFERLRRCEELVKKKNATVSQIAMAWIYAQPMNTFVVVSTSNAKRMQQNVEALQLKLTKEEAAYLDLDVDKL